MVFFDWSHLKSVRGLQNPYEKSESGAIQQQDNSNFHFFRWGFCHPQTLRTFCVGQVKKHPVVF